MIPARRPITTVTFDLWETLIRDSREIGAPRQQIRLETTYSVLKSQGHPLSASHIESAYQRCQRALNELRKRDGDVTFDEQIDRFLEEIEVGLSTSLPPQARHRIASRYADSYLEHPPKVDEYAGALLKGLHEQKYLIGLICNTGSTPGRTQRLFLKQAGLADYFDAMTFSDEERMSKPAIAIFHNTLERLGGTPPASIHVGDHPRNDVYGAKQAGMRAVWLKRKEEPAEAQADATIESLDQVREAIFRVERAIAEADFS